MLSEVSHVRVVGEAMTAASALDKVWSLRPDVVILDIQMPGLSGMYVLEKMKKFPPMPKVIVLTNYPFPHFRNACLAGGADYFFDKSKDFEKILDVFRTNGLSVTS
jgi:DNA-binding NarL/FixJ family response regulator